MMRTIQSEVEVLASDVPNLNATFSKMAEGQSFVAGVCFEKQETNTFRVHHETYKTCGVVMHADLNAADNILYRYTQYFLQAAINQPIALHADRASPRL